MFIEQSITSDNKFWKYIVGIVLIMILWTIGQLPLLFAVTLKSMADGNGVPLDEEVLMTTLDSNTTLFLLMLSTAFAVAGVYIAVRFIHKQSFVSMVTARPKLDWKRIFFAFTIWAILSIISALADYWMNPEDYVLQFQPVPFVILLVISIVMVPIQTSSEEFLFRGYLMQGFGNLARNRWIPLVLTSSIFGLMHIANPEVDKMGYIVLIYYIGTGFFLGILTLMDDGMELSLGFHAANNLIGALLVTADWSAFKTHAIFKDISEPSAGIDIILPVVIVYPVLLFIFSKKYQWTDWRQKLTGNVNPLNQSQSIETISNHE
jgi:membrane protease YdiL (CAAX protease family)